MSALELNTESEQAAAIEEGVSGIDEAPALVHGAAVTTTTAGAAVDTSPAAGASSSAEGESGSSGCTLIAKWQGNTIELPVLSMGTTIREVKVRPVK